MDITSGRFQTLVRRFDLQPGRIASTQSGLDECGDLVNADNSGKLLVDGEWRDYRDPDSPDLDNHPWWAEYSVDFDYDLSDDDDFHSFDVQLSVDNPSHPDAKGLGSFGNDYLAGGDDNDMLFGQMGNDLVMGDGDIESAATAEFHVGASRSPDGCPDNDTLDSSPTRGGTCDAVGDLDLIASEDDLGADGQDYIEGNGGNDIALGGLGQDDILGGSSDFFSLTAAELRPDGADLLFGGSGLHTDRSDNGGVDPGQVIDGERHASDADAIAGDNAQIIRIVGTNGIDECDITNGVGCQLGDDLYVSYVYDDAYDDPNTAEVEGEIVVRGVTLLDYTPGGPDFHPELFDLGGDGPCSTSAPETQNGCSEIYVIENPDGTNREQTFAPDEWNEIFGNDEVHGGLSDDIIYVGGGSDTVFGDADDDNILGGWGNDWISGGVGSDGVLGDDGRIFTSRNSDQGWTAGSDTRQPTNGVGSGDEDVFSEPLFGITAFQPQGTCTENKSVLCGDFLDQYIATPGQVQNAVINIDGDLKKTVDLTPFNLTPNTLGADADWMLFDANNSDDVIFGGLGGEILPNYPTEISHRKNEDPPFGETRGVQGDFLHGGAGDDAMAGGEAIWNGYTQVYDDAGALWDADGDGTSDAMRTDWSRPYNPGDLLHFGEDADAWHNQGPIVNRLGEFALYDEYDPRRTIMLNPDATVNKENDSEALTWFLNLYSDEGPELDGCVEYLPNGTCVTFDFRHSDGGDAAFGDLGNDWLVGGTGQDTLYGGWGNDLHNADDVMTVVGEGEFGDQKGKKIQPSPNDTPDTHPLFQDRTYGGAGIDVHIGNTGGDRLIDWVGEFNSYIVPFSVFGISTVSRQVPPWMFEFLYALSANHGADPTRDEDQNANDPDLEERNGEPYGELGLVTQKDHGLWQDQTGGPSDPQPGNIPGGARDVLESADFNDGMMATFVRDTGSWEVNAGSLAVSAESLGQDAASVWYHDEYLPVYFEIEAQISIVKPTGGWKANSYVIFDYFGPTDFKFAGLDDSINKLVVGQRDENGWHVVAQSSVQGGVKHSKWYDVLVAINGTNVVVLVDGNEYFTHTFAPRVIDDVSYGLNKGLIGFGSENSRGLFDDTKVQILPPDITYEYEETFDGSAGQFTSGAQRGTWSVNGKAYHGSPATDEDLGFSTLDLGLATGLATSSYVEIEANVDTNAMGGIIFDRYSDQDFKFVALDDASDKVLVGHHEPRKGWVVDSEADFSMNGNQGHDVKLAMKGSSVSVTVDGSLVTSHAFHAPIVDGGVGLLTKDGDSSFGSFAFRTNDPALDAPVAAASMAYVFDPLDVTRDGYISPADAQAVIHGLNDLNQGGVPGNMETLDVSQDGYLSPVDALLVIRRLNQVNDIYRSTDEVLAIPAPPVEPTTSAATRYADRTLGELTDLPASVPRSEPASTLEPIDLAALAVARDLTDDADRDKSNVDKLFGDLGENDWL